VRRLARFLSVPIVTVFAITVAGQTRPDFSGQWTIEPEPTQAPTATGRSGQGVSERGGGGDRVGGGRGAPRSGEMGSGWGSNITVTQDPQKLIIEYMFFARGDMQPPLKFVYALDGSESRNSVMMGRGIQVQTSKTRWDDDKLVITTVHTFAHPETGQPMSSELKQTLSLESPGRLIVEAVRSGVLGGPASTTRAIYKK
jgi:hypothetical protein